VRPQPTEPSSPTPSTPPGPLAARPEASSQDPRWTRKLERATDLDHLLIWRRTPETRLLWSILHPIDRGCERARRLPAVETAERLARVHA
jgi:hypothetical protein